MLTKESWEKLLELSKKYDFILIGGWAAFLWTKTHKSRDIDVVVDQTTLNRFKSEFRLFKNERLRKYEVKFEKFDLEVYVEYYSRLAIPPEELKLYKSTVEGISTLRPEALLVLKQAAEIDRRGSTKGTKDAIDILTILLHAQIDWEYYLSLLEKYGKENFLPELQNTVASYDEKNVSYLGQGFKQFKGWQKQVLQTLRKLRQKKGK